MNIPWFQDFQLNNRSFFPSSFSFICLFCMLESCFRCLLAWQLGAKLLLPTETLYRKINCFSIKCWHIFSIFIHLYFCYFARLFSIGLRVRFGELRWLKAHHGDDIVLISVMIRFILNKWQIIWPERWFALLERAIKAFINNCDGIFFWPPVVYWLWSSHIGHFTFYESIQFKFSGAWVMSIKMYLISTVFINGCVLQRFCWDIRGGAAWARQNKNWKSCRIVSWSTVFLGSFHALTFVQIYQQRMACIGDVAAPKKKIVTGFYHWILNFRLVFFHSHSFR